MFWAIIFALAILFPMSIPRQLSALGTSTMISFLCVVFVIAVIICECLLNRRVNPDLHQSLVSAALTFKIEGRAILNAFPIMIFSYMYQPNLPQIFHELVPKSESMMRRVITIGTMVAASAYFLTGFFGFATFVQNAGLDGIMSTQNIFTAPYFNEPYLVFSMYLLIAGVVLSTPLSVLPCKDTLEELALGQSRLMSDSENFFVTLVVVAICLMFAVFVPNIGDAMLVVGATSNPIVGFVLPVAFWLKIDKSPRYSAGRIVAISVATVTCILSLISLGFWVQKKLQPAPIAA